MRHRQTGYCLLRGKGLEIGAFQRPAALPPGCAVTYCDIRSREESLQVFPELTAEMLVPVDVIADLDKDGLAVFPEASFDFVILNQVIAHLANPIGAIETVFRIVKPRGLVVLSTHDKFFSFDRKRASPTLDHLLDEYHRKVDSVSDEHYASFLRVAHPRVFYHGAEELANALVNARARREHAHTWDSPGFDDFLQDALDFLGINAVKRYESLGQDNRLEYFSIWQKYASAEEFTLITADSRRQFERTADRLLEAQEAEAMLLDEKNALQDQIATLHALLNSRTCRWSAPLRKLVRQGRKLRALCAQKGLAGGVAAAVQIVLGGISHSAPGSPEQESPETWQLIPASREQRIFPHRAETDIIVCVHNALEDVQRCLSSLIRHTLPPYNLILVDDGSDEATRSYLKTFAAGQGAQLVRNEEARGYTCAANQGLRAATGDCVVLMNSDTVATPDWLDRMAMCAESDSAIGMVGPLSNTASWQSIPEVEQDGDWAANPLPEGMTVDEMAILVAAHSARLYPRIPFLNGFCLYIKRALLEQIGYFDEEAFGRGYGEENDYCLRARKAGWQLAVADDTYIYHAQSKSYSHERRKTLSDLAGAALAAKHGHEIIEQGVAVCRDDRIMQGVRARARLLLERRDFIERGRQAWEGRRVLFVMPVMSAGGGANVVISEARAMIAMGVDARILSLNWIRDAFEESYPALDVPVVYLETENEFVDVAKRFDVVIATASYTVPWLEKLPEGAAAPLLAYYIQDFEPYFYADGSSEHQMAQNSYTALSHVQSITKTEWNRREVLEKVGVECAVVGPSFDVDVFIPRIRRKPAPPSGKLRICAMVRPITPRRNPALTMRVLRDIWQIHGDRVEVVIFGVSSDDPTFLSLSHDFPHVNLGELTTRKMAALLNEMDVFVDFSTYQAMGLTAMEAMGCGAAVIVPHAGGGDSFARDEENSLMVDTSSEKGCFNALESLVLNDELRFRLQRQAQVDVVQHFPERAAFNILANLLGKGAQ